mgnify:CR=1 FL=1
MKRVRSVTRKRFAFKRVTLRKRDNNSISSNGLLMKSSAPALRPSARESRSLFHSVSRDATTEIAPEAGRFSRDARAIVSEPLDDLEADWVAVPEASFLTIHRGRITSESFAPITP